jgi:O-antigen/teichoic acid export membrane protein
MRIDVIVVSFALGAGAVGLYTLAVGLAEMLWQLSSPLCIAAFPRIATGEEREGAAFTAKLIRHIIVLIVPVAALCFAIAPPLIGLVYGPAFEATGGAFRWILPGVAAYAIEVPLGYFLMVRLARPWLIVAIQCVSIAACGALTLATVHRFGIDGAAAATSITYIAVVLIKGAIFARATGTSARDLLLVRRDELLDAARLGRRLVARLSPIRV